MILKGKGFTKDKRLDQRSIRLCLTTDDICELLGITKNALRKRIERGTLNFTGDPIKDFHMLAELF